MRTRILPAARRRGFFNTRITIPGGTTNNWEVPGPTVTQTGVNIPIGPDPGTYTGTKYVIDASTYNMHRTTWCKIRFVPAQNRFNAKNQLAMWVSSDPDAKIPTGDAAIRQQCLSAKGELFHSEFSIEKIFKIPPSMYKNFSTGQGDNSSGTAFQPQGRIFIVPLANGDTAAWNYGITIIQFQTTLSGPGTTQLKEPAPVNPNMDPYKLDVVHDMTSWHTNSRVHILDSLMDDFSKHWIALKGNYGITTAFWITDGTAVLSSDVKEACAYYYITNGTVDKKPDMPFDITEYFKWNPTIKQWESFSPPDFYIKTIGPNIVTTQEIVKSEGDHIINHELHVTPYYNDRLMVEDDGKQFTTNVKFSEEQPVKVTNRVDIDGGNLTPVTIVGI